MTPHLFLRIALYSTFFWAGPFVGSAQTETVIDFRIDLHKTCQTIENFGASDAWSCQFVGNWPDADRNTMADWLFSTDTLPNGNPKGIGLSLWRFNWGAGSAQQGTASGIKDEWRRAGPRSQGQLWFLKAAQRRGVRQFLGFFNSPPTHLTLNGKAYADSGHSNIDPAKYGAFAVYAAGEIKDLQQNTGIALDYLSPVNEPQWDWSDGGQEGCPYTNKDISSLTKAFNTALRENKLKTKLLLTESGHHKYLLGDDGKPGRGNQVMDLFDPSAENYIGNLPAVAGIIASHSYFSSSPFSQAMDLRKRVAEKVATIPGLRYWQTEYCILGDNDGEINGSGRDTGMDAALYLARVIYTDLTAGNATAWQWWLAISPYNYKDGLIYIDRNKTGGAYHDSKMLWALGNYSRFIRPGMQRVQVETPPTDSLLVSAYKDEKKRKLVAVVINKTNTGHSVSLDDPAGRPLCRGRSDTYTTSATGRLEKHPQSAGKIAIGPRSIVTIEMKYD